MFKPIRGRWLVPSGNGLSLDHYKNGDLVLRILRGLVGDPRGKFRPSWNGPYVIRELTPKGVAWLIDLDGNQFSELTNVDQLKKYYV